MPACHMVNQQEGVLPRKTRDVAFFEKSSLLFHTSACLCCPGAGTAEKRKVSTEYRDHVRKFVPTLQSYSLTRAAEHLQKWVDNELEMAPLLDVSAQLV